MSTSKTPTGAGKSSSATDPRTGRTYDVAPLFELAGPQGLADLTENFRELLDYVRDVAQLEADGMLDFGPKSWVSADCRYFVQLAEAFALVLGKLVASTRTADGQPVVGSDIDPEDDGILRALLMQSNWPVGAVLDGLEAAADHLRQEADELSDNPAAAENGGWAGGYLYQLLRDLAFALQTLHRPVVPPTPPPGGPGAGRGRPARPTAAGRVVPMPVPQPTPKARAKARASVMTVLGGTFTPHLRAAA
jgi:hypothetical protein